MFGVPVFILTDQDDNDLDNQIGIGCKIIVKPIEFDKLLFKIKNKLIHHDHLIKKLHFDVLTGLPNDIHFHHTFNQLVYKNNKMKMPLCMLLIKMDQLETLYSVFGFDMIDSMITRLSRFLKKSLNQSLLLSRLNNHSFGVLFKESQENVVVEQIKNILNRFKFYVNNKELPINFLVCLVKIPHTRAKSEYWMEKLAQLEHTVQSIQYDKMMLFKEERESATKSFHIIIIDDDRLVRKIVSDQLSQLKIDGYELKIKSFREGEEFFQSEWFYPDEYYVFIIDGILPRMDGLEILQRLKQHEQNDNFSMVMLTGRKSERDVVKGLELGADDYLTKPFSLGELTMRVKRLLLRRIEK